MISFVAVLAAMAVFVFSPDSHAADRKIKVRVPGIT
jgi:hypothetical protein